MKGHLNAHVWAAVAFATVSFLGSSVVTELAAEPQRTQPRQQQSDTMRFRGMDIDGDGRITRAEWRGNDRSFRNHDWNNDGMLSGDEVRLGARHTRGAQLPATGFYDWTPAGFRTIDRNRDARITRAEWSHDYELFLRADRNGDNVLTLAEFLGDDTTDRDVEDRFDDLDLDYDGRIERDEWHGTRDAFEWLDRNQDGSLSRAETVGDDAPVGTSGRRVRSNQIVIVDAQVRWTDTGIDLRAGDRLQLRSDGTVVLSANLEGTDTATPVGSRTGRRAADAPFPQMPAGGLVARVGDSAPLFIGGRETFDRLPASGRLYLGVNDDDLRDNQGHFRVTISVER